MKNIFSILIVVLAISTAGCGELFEEEGSATHNPGQNCNECHGFSYAGTIYSDPDGTSAVKDAVLTITQTDGRELVMKSNSAGNFYTSSGSPTTGYLVSVTDGTNTKEKRDEVTSGACNKSGCHVTSGQGKIYVR